MKFSFVLVLSSFALLSCNGLKENACDCMLDYEIMYVEYNEVQSAIACLEDQGIELSLEDEETAELISEMDPICPKESRKLWMLCKNLDEGVIIRE